MRLPAPSEPGSVRPRCQSVLEIERKGQVTEYRIHRGQHEIGGTAEAILSVLTALATLMAFFNTGAGPADQ